MPFAAALDPSTLEFWTHVGVAFFCGGVIGLERQIRGKAAGMRTTVLITLGTSFFVAESAAVMPAGVDPSRVLGQVVTGIGFLGAGVILARGDRIIGVTTAAVIWLLAAIGSLIGFGYLRAAMVGTLLALLVLIGMEGIERLLVRNATRRGSGVHSTIEGG
ncbi:MAG TPA: MgtC/SapB family protein [Gemmatimonadales bacterium]|nr:MgtC/SapB family protein [Gemmatimonadales bacterium]